MAQVNQVRKKCVMSKNDIVKYQIMTHCFFNKTQISDSDVECITLLATTDYNELHVLCKRACELNIFKTPQSVRNSLNKLEKKGILIKRGKNKKKLTINPDIGLVTSGNVLLNYNFLAVETSEGKASD